MTKRVRKYIAATMVALMMVSNVHPVLAVRAAQEVSEEATVECTTEGQTESTQEEFATEEEATEAFTTEEITTEEIATEEVTTTEESTEEATAEASTESNLEVMVMEEAVTAGSSQRKLVEDYVVRLYSTLFGRNPGKQEVEYWTASILGLEAKNTKYNKNTDMKKRSASNVACYFLLSDEMNRKQLSDYAYVTILYNCLMNRYDGQQHAKSRFGKIDKGGRKYWVDRLKRGNSRDYVCSQFLESAEFDKICKMYQVEKGTERRTQPQDGVVTVVESIYKNLLNRGTGDTAGVRYWVDQYKDGKRNMVDIAENFVWSDEFRSKNVSKEEYVKLMYRTFMLREYDQAGLDHWVNKLTYAVGGSQGGEGYFRVVNPDGYGDTDYGRKQVMYSFLRSKEFENFLVKNHMQPIASMVPVENPQTDRAKFDWEYVKRRIPQIMMDDYGIRAARLSKRTLEEAYAFGYNGYQQEGGLDSIAENPLVRKETAKLNHVYNCENWARKFCEKYYKFYIYDGTPELDEREYYQTHYLEIAIYQTKRWKLYDLGDPIDDDPDEISVDWVYFFGDSKEEIK